jgi:hypothetical protein
VSDVLGDDMCAITLAVTCVCALFPCLSVAVTVIVKFVFLSNAGPVSLLRNNPFESIWKYFADAAVTGV